MDSQNSNLEDKMSRLTHKFNSKSSNVRKRRMSSYSGEGTQQEEASYSALNVRAFTFDAEIQTDSTLSYSLCGLALPVLL